MAKYISIDNSATAVHTLVAKNIQLGTSTISSISMTNESLNTPCNAYLYLDDGSNIFILWSGRFSNVGPFTLAPTFVYNEKHHLSYDQRKYNLKINLAPDGGNRNFSIIIN